ncbi:MAG TPA: hypothetical protein ENI99_01055 [Sedimenticola sp.]|nr:hypothetical protein [Sedimenticola sp.]
MTLDPVEVEERVPAVSFDVVVEMNLSYQKARLEIQACWFGNDALNDFESRLGDLIQQESGDVVLANIKGKPVLTISKAGKNINFIIEATDTMGLGKARIEVPGYSSELQEILGRIKSYPKSW